MIESPWLAGWFEQQKATSQHQYYFNLVLNRFHKQITNTEYFNWEQILTLFSIHKVVTNRDYSLFNFCKFYNTEGPVHCDGDSVESYSALVLDYDGEGATIEKAKEQFKDYTYLGYTSFRHIITGVEKFRIILPFAEDCPVEEWRARKSGSFLDFAGPTIDRSSCAVSRVFYVPCCFEENLQYAQCWNNTGKLLDWKGLVAEEVKVYEATTTFSAAEPTTITRLLDELKKYELILDYSDRFWVARAAERHLGTARAITEMQHRWPDAMYNGKYKNMLKSAPKNPPGIPTLMKRIRLHNPNFEAYNEVIYANNKVGRLQKKIAKRYFRSDDGKSNT